MHEIVLINARCEGDPEIGKFADFLRRKFEGQAQVEVVEMETCTDYAAVPPALIEQLAGQQIDGIPVLVLNGRVLSAGTLPNWMDSLETITAAMRAPARTA
ncbi:hypothetical protein [Streptacidiphilus carbonis]|uniref:hypothetical protein n=1 Tax=Streptacidiphilus carbonis TaxID=105422 RepID=UPI0005AA32A3|nr:hypothetical protein [Streptacidiphilus carbonis]